MADIQTVARELYALPLSEFTAARNAAAKELPGLARLQKASASAWLVNAVARERPDLIDSVESLGASLLAAQTARDRTAMTTLSRERRELLRSAVAAAAELNPGANSATLIDVEHSLAAAMTDPDAAAAVRSGLLVRALTANGLDPVDLSLALAIDGTTPLSSRAGARKPKVDREAAAAQRAEAARAALNVAVERLDEAQSQLTATQEAVSGALATRDSLVADRDELQAQLDAVDAEISAADRAIRAARTDQERARLVAERSGKAVERARGGLA